MHKHSHCGFLSISLCFYSGSYSQDSEKCKGLWFGDWGKIKFESYPVSTFVPCVILGWVIDCCCSVTKSCLTLCNSGDCSTPGFPVLHYLPEFAQSHRYPYTKRNDNTIRFTVKNKGKCLLPINVSRSLTHYHAYSNESIKVSYFSPLFCRPESPALLFPSWELGSCTDVLASPSLDAWVCPITGLPASEFCWLLGFSMYPSHPLLHLRPQFTQVNSPQNCDCKWAQDK